MASEKEQFVSQLKTNYLASTAAMDEMIRREVQKYKEQILTASLQGQTSTSTNGLIGPSICDRLLNLGIVINEKKDEDGYPYHVLVWEQLVKAS